jgi:hypothetical protein
MTHDPLQSQPEQKPPPGLGQVLEQMKREADAVIRQIAAASGAAEHRQRAGIFEVFAVMRPRFGPANALLFSEREKKLVELTHALGLADPMPPDVDGHLLDRYFGAIERAAEALKGCGLQVEILPVSSRAIDWAPEVPGRMVRATDPTRTLPEYIPYAELRPDPPTPKRVPPRVTLYLFLPTQMSSAQGLMTRQQPGELVGALQGAYVFSLQAPQSGDTDDGKTAATILDAVFPNAKPIDEPKLAATLGAQTAEQLRGVLRVSAETPPKSAPSPAGLPTFIEAVLWSVARGGEIEHTLLPTR